MKRRYYQMTEKVELKPTKRDAFLVGKVKLRDDAFKIDQKSKTGYVYSNVNFGVETGDGNVVYVEAMGGFNAQAPLPIKAKNKDNQDLEINWTDRNNPKILEQVADYKLLKASLVQNESKAFLSAYDLIAYLKTVLVDGMEVSVRATRKMSVFKGEPQTKYELVSISLPYVKKDEEGKELPTEYRAKFTQTLLIDEDSLNITAEDEENGETLIQAYGVDYIGKYDGEQIKKNVLFPIVLNVKVDTDKAKMIAEKLFSVDSGKVTEITVEGDIIEGYDKASGNDVELEISEETQELIDLGLFTLEEVKQKVQVRGNKVSKLLFLRPSVFKDEESGIAQLRVNTDKYSLEDLVFYEQAINGEIEEETHTEQQIEGDSTAEGGDDWMKALGI